MSGRTQSVIGVSANTKGGTEDWTDDFDLALPEKPPSPSSPSPVAASLLRIAKEGIDAPRHQHNSKVSSYTTGTGAKKSLVPPSPIVIAPYGSKSPAVGAVSGSRGSGSTNAFPSRPRHRKDPQRDGEHLNHSRYSTHRRQEDKDGRNSTRKSRQDSIRPRRGSRTDSARSHPSSRAGSAGEETTVRRRRSREDKIPHARVTPADSGVGKGVREGGKQQIEVSVDVDDSPSDSEVMPAPQPRALRTSSIGIKRVSQNVTELYVIQTLRKHSRRVPCSALVLVQDGESPKHLLSTECEVDSLLLRWFIVIAAVVDGLQFWHEDQSCLLRRPRRPTAHSEGGCHTFLS